MINRVLPPCSSRDPWERYAFPRARSHAFAIAALSAVLVPLWALVDVTSVPSRLPVFLILRALNAIVMMGVILCLLRARSLRTARWCGVIALGMPGVLVAPMLALVDANFWLYLLGFCLIPLGGGTMFGWPARWTIVTFGTMAVACVVSQLLWRHRTGSELVAGAIFLTTVMSISAVGIGVRYRLEREGFAAADALQRQNEELSDVIVRLRDAQARLVEAEKLSALGRMLAALSHEINNPVHVINTNLQPMREHIVGIGAVLDEVERHFEAMPPRVRELWEQHDVGHARNDLAAAFDDVGEAARRIRAIHQDLRSFIRGDAPQRVVRDPNPGLRATVTMLRRGLPPNVRIVAEYGNLPPILHQPGRLNQVFLNLLQNAIDAVGSSGTIFVRSSARDGWVDFELCDTGPGVSAHVEARLFEPFFTTKTGGRGTGLGLAISRRIVEDHGGVLRLDRTYENGAKFVVSLPIHGSVVQADPPAGDGKEAEGEPERDGVGSDDRHSEIRLRSA